MPRIRIDDLDDPRIADFRHVSDARLLEEKGLFVAEGRLVVRRLIEDGRYRVRSLLVRDNGDGGLLEAMAGPERNPVPLFPVFVVSLDLMRRLTGFNFHRGCLALAERPAPSVAADLLAGTRTRAPLVVLEEVTNADNVGGVFRNAAAFGASAVLLSPGCCDPLYRKAIRTSMAASIRVPFARVAPWPAALSAVKKAGWTLVALTPSQDARDLAAFAADPARPRHLALVVGTEGAGLGAAAEALADSRVRIPMAPGVDSLNLATATGIALHALSVANWRLKIED